MNQQDIARRWAKQHVNRRGSCSAKAGSFFYEGPTIYSWGHHWPIATIRTLEDTGEQVVLFHNVSHTSSTNRHAYEAYCVARGRFPIHQVEHDYWSDVTDHASLNHCIERTKEAEAQRAEEARIRRNENAKRNKEHRCCMLRQELEREAGADLDDMPDATVMKLARMCRLTAGGRNRWHRPTPDKNLCDFLGTLFAEQPDLVKNPRQLAKILNNYQLLAA
jgi:hypothetical protein